MIAHRRLFALLAVVLFSYGVAQAQVEKRLHPGRAFVIDERLAVLRREPHLQGQVLKRLKVGRPAQIIEARRTSPDGPKFYRVMVTRRTSGWIHEGAIAAPGRPGDDARVAQLIEAMDDSFDRLTLCKLFSEKFANSPLLPKVLLAMGEELERAAQTLTRNAGRRLKGLREPGGRTRDYYLSDTGLDRYSKLDAKFDYLAKIGEYVYDGQVYREILKRFPRSEQAAMARQRLEAAAQKMAQNP